jgi:Family of unknown function (DUF5317)
MLLVAAFALIVISVPLAGGRLSALTKLELSYTWLLPISLAIQIAIISVAPEGIGWTRPALHVASYALIIGFLIANRTLAGLRIMSLGVAMNALAITANGGVMPASRFAVELAGRTTSPGSFANSSVVARPKLAFLGDIFAWPDPLPLHNVFSAGDVCILLGAAIVLHHVCGSRRPFRPRDEVKNRLQPIKPL